MPGQAYAGPVHMRHARLAVAVGALSTVALLSGCITVNTSPEATVTATVTAPTSAPTPGASTTGASTTGAPTLSPPVTPTQTVPAPESNSPASSLTLAQAMASGSGYGFGEDRCYEAELAESDPTFGTLYLSDYGKDHRRDCQSIDAVVAIVHESGDTWEMVDWFLSPDCVSARENLEDFGASEAVIGEIIGDWPC